MYVLPAIGDVWVSPSDQHVYLIVDIKKEYAVALMISCEYRENLLVEMFHDMTYSMPPSWRLVA